MGRAVGGASAAGCGAFGLVSLIIGIGLVAWLSSTALDGMGGGDGGRATSTTLAAAVVDLATTDAEVAVAAPPDLDDGGTVSVTATGLPTGAATATLTVCLAHPPGDADGCDAATASVAPIDADGEVAIDRTVPRVITVDDIAYDCAAAPSACVLRVRLAGDARGEGVTAALSFAPGLAAVDAQAPPAG